MNSRVELSRCHRCGITSHPGQVWKKCLICKGPVETIEAEVYEVDPRNFTDFMDQIMPPPERFMDAMREYAKQLEDEIISGRYDPSKYMDPPKPGDVPLGEFTMRIGPPPGDMPSYSELEHAPRKNGIKPMDKATFTKLWNGEWPES